MAAPLELGREGKVDLAMADEEAAGAEDKVWAVALVVPEALEAAETVEAAVVAGW